MRESEDRLRLAVESTGLGTFDFYPQTGKLVWSDITKSHFGIAPQTEIDHEIFLAAVHPDDRERIRQTGLALTTPGNDGQLATEYRTIGVEDGKERWLAVRGRMLFDRRGPGDAVDRHHARHQPPQTPGGRSTPASRRVAEADGRSAGGHLRDLRRGVQRNHGESGGLCDDRNQGGGEPFVSPQKEVQLQPGGFCATASRFPPKNCPCSWPLLAESRFGIANWRRFWRAVPGNFSGAMRARCAMPPVRFEARSQPFRTSQRVSSERRPRCARVKSDSATRRTPPRSSCGTGTPRSASPSSISRSPSLPVCRLIS